MVNEDKHIASQQEPSDLTSGVNVVAKYADRLLPDDVRSVQEIAFLEGMYTTMLEQGLLSKGDVEYIEGQPNEDFRIRTLDGIVCSRIDALSHLPNKKFFDKYMRKMLEDVCKNYDLYAQKDMDVAVLFSDLNDFKHVNDVYGHAVGDRVLQHLSEVWGGVVRSGFTLVDEFSQAEHRHGISGAPKALVGRDFLSRWAGDEFAVIVPYPKKYINLDAIKNRFLTALDKQPFQFEMDGKTHEIPLRASIGSLSVVEYMKDYADTMKVHPKDINAEDIEVLSEEIFAVVDEEMYQQKRASKGITYVPDQAVGYIGKSWADVAGYAVSDIPNPNPKLGTEEISPTYTFHYQPK